MQGVLLFLLFYYFALFDANLNLVIQLLTGLLLITIRKRYKHVPKGLGDFKGNQIFKAQGSLIFKDISQV